MKQNKDIWVEEVLNSTEGMTPARPDRELYNNIKSRLGKAMPGAKRISLGMMSAAAACLLVLFALNIKALSNYAQADREQAEEKTGTVMEDLIEYYELGSNSVGL